MKKLLLSVLVLTLVAAACVQPAAQNDGYAGSAAQEQPSPEEEVLLDHTVRVSARDRWHSAFRINTRCEVTIQVDGEAHTDKGFSVVVIDPQGRQHARRDAVMSFNETITLPRGEFGVVVSNTENMVRQMTVRVLVIARSTP